MELDQTTQEPQQGEIQDSQAQHRKRGRAWVIAAGVLAAGPFIAAGLVMSVHVSRLPSELGWYAPMIILQSALLAYGFGVGIIGLIAAALSTTDHAKEASAALIVIGLFFMTLGPAARSFAVGMLLSGKASPLVFFMPVALFVYAASLLTDARRTANRSQQ